MTAVDVKLDVKRLTALAEKATVCAREVVDENEGDGLPRRPLWCVKTPGVDDVGFPDDAPCIDVTIHIGYEADAHFIAACDPQTILSLCNHVGLLECALRETISALEAANHPKRYTDNWRALLKQE